MVFGPFVDIWREIVSLKPGFLSKTPHFNFITVHCESSERLGWLSVADFIMS